LDDVGAGGCKWSVACGNLTLVAFALTCALDAAASAVLVDLFDRDLRDGRQPRESERLALRVISLGMCAAGASTAVQSVWRLVRGSDATATIAGPAIAAISLVVLSGFAHRKTLIAYRAGRAGLLADAQLTKIGVAWQAYRSWGQERTCSGIRLGSIPSPRSSSQSSSPA
jgi:hypothetical protein